MTSAVLKVTDQSFANDVINAEGAVLVDFWAPWCGPCKMMAPVLDELASEYEPETLTIAKLNVDENPETTQKFGIVSIPTLLVFKGGNVVGKLVGFMPKPSLKAKLATIL